MSTIKDKNILITGGASGIGRQLALKLASQGGNIIIWDLNTAGMESVAKEISARKGKVKTYRCDVSDRDMVYSLAREVQRDLGTVDILINNAGIVNGKAFTEMSDEAIENSLKINVMAHYWTTKAFLPAMIAQNDGHIVTLSSAAGIIGVYRLPTYCTAKFANFGFNESLRMEFKMRKINIRTTVVCPYYVDTGMFKGVQTRFPLLLPILKGKYVADRIAKAIKKNQTRVLMPWIVYTVWLFRLFPTFIFDTVATFLGINNTMDKFVGKGNKE